MTDDAHDPTQDDLVLASAYLDGEVTPDERARVEQEPALLAEVERLRQVRAVLAADVEPAAVSVRESQLAAALDVFDQLDAAGAAAASSVAPISAARGRRARRTNDRSGGERVRLVLGVAAGLVVVAGVGAVIRGVIVGTDSDDTDVQIAAVEEPAEESVGPSEQDIAVEIQGGNTNDEGPTEVDDSEVARDVLQSELDSSVQADAPAAAEAPLADEAESLAEESPAAEQPESAEAPVEESSDAAGGAGSFPTADDDSETLAAAGDPPPETDLVALATPNDLADFAAPAAYAPSTAGGDQEATLALCQAEPPNGLGIDRLAEPAIVDGDPVVVGVDLDAGLAYAFRDDCSVVLQATLPSEADFLAAIPSTPTTTQAP